MPPEFVDKLRQLRDGRLGNDGLNEGSRQLLEDAPRAWSGQAA
jgi:hypothetical protein